jgi:ribonuclease HI
MELLAAVEALRSIPAGALVELRSDSELLIHGMRFRVFRWQKR